MRFDKWIAVAALSFVVGTGKDSIAVVNGVGVSSNSNIVEVVRTDGIGGTGTAITNKWVLTAGHVEGGQPAANLTVWFNGTPFSVANVVNHPSLDFSLLQLSSPLTINGSTTGFQQFLYTAPSSSLNSKPLTLYGFGSTTCGGPLSSTETQGTMIASSLMDQYTVVSNSSSSNQGSTGGDSGGPLMYFYGSHWVEYLTGVTKSGNCTTLPFNDNASRPENFEQWALETIYGAAVHIPIAEPAGDPAAGKGEWFLYSGGPAWGGSDNAGYTTGESQFWQSPLETNDFNCTWYWNPCPGYNGYYRYSAKYALNGTDEVWINNSYNTATMTGSAQYWWWGLGDMRICYSTGYSGGSTMNWITVTCSSSSPAPTVVCHGPRCVQTGWPLPASYTASATWNPCDGNGFWYMLDYDTTGSDKVWVGSASYSGVGVTGWVSVPGGSAAVTVQTFSPNQYSYGIRSLKAWCQSW